MDILGLVGGVGAGLAGGVTAGLFGVSPGGGLVVFSVLLLGAEQHVAQGIALVAQIPPTAASGLRRSAKAGIGVPLHWLGWLVAGFVFGGIGGAFGANRMGAATLQWCYVAYLVTLDAMLILRRSKPRAGDTRTAEPGAVALILVGLAAGLSSGFLGIGGGLATVVGLSAILGVAQERARMAGLALSLVPSTAPSAWVYWSSGTLASWEVLTGVILGLIAGTDVGAWLATRLPPLLLHRALVVFLSVMAAYMTFRALVAS